LKASPVQRYPATTSAARPRPVAVKAAPNHRPARH
jgi:hypothetical protein